MNGIMYIHRWTFLLIYIKIHRSLISQQVVSKPSFDQRGHSTCSDLTIINRSTSAAGLIPPRPNAICWGSLFARYSLYLYFLYLFLLFLFFLFVFLIFLVFLWMDMDMERKWKWKYCNIRHEWFIAYSKNVQ